MKKIIPVILVIFIALFFVIKNKTNQPDIIETNGLITTTEPTLKIFPIPEQKIKVIFDTNGGRPEIPDQYVQDIIEEPQTVYKDGYMFNGWKDYNGNGYNFSKNIAENGISSNTVVLTADWKQIHKVEYYINGEKYMENNVMEGEEVKLPEPEKIDGYEFSGWKEEEDKEITDNTEIDHDTVLVAEYKELPRYNIDYYLNGGTFQVDNPYTYTEDDDIKIENPVKIGYTFKGWKGTDIEDIEKEIRIHNQTGNREYHAIWEEKEFPQNYFPEKITTIKDQKDKEWCVAYSTIATLEQSAIKQLDMDDNIDLSEEQLAYATYYHITDPLGLTKDDYKESELTVYQGSLIQNYITTLSTQVGPVSEGQPIDKGYTNIELSVKGYKQVDSRDMAQVKESIMQKGAVMMAVHMRQENYSNYTYSPENTPSDHCVCVVGWDDNIPKERFGDNCPENGGWIAKNSWGIDNPWNSGYVFISYYDGSVDSEGAVSITVSRKDYDNVYEYDGNEFGNGIYGVKNSANVFTATSDLYVESAGATIFSQGAYTLTLHKITDETIKPWENEEIARAEFTATGIYEFQSYYTAEFDNKPLIQQGEKFAICLKRSNGDEYILGADMTASTGWSTYHSGSKEGESYIDDYKYDENAGYTPRIRGFVKNR